MTAAMEVSTFYADPRYTAVRPSERQLSWQRMEFYAFVHFGMNTMTDREWGLGNEDPRLFDPSHLDVDQWMENIVAAGMSGLIITAKHHDGFCLWPSRLSDHTIAASPWLEGRGDLLRLISDSAARHGLKLGIYLSPWDRTEPTYGTGEAYDDYFVAQLEEVLTGYGPVFSVWFDGANGEGADGRTQEYDWERYYATIRRLQPDAVISVCGPDVRWCGNEAGHTRANEWSVVPAALRNLEQIADKSQHVDDGEFSRAVRSDDEDLGSRAALEGHLDELVWYPAEVNTSIRPGWFYHRAEDDQVRSGRELFDLWCHSVGGNSTLLLNVPPDERGLIAEPDVAALRDLGLRIADFARRALPAHPVVSSGTVGTDGSGWRPSPDDENPSILLELDAPAVVEAVVLREQIELGQRMEKLDVSGVLGGVEFPIASTEAIGYQRILRFDPVRVDAVRVRVRQARALPALAQIRVVGATDTP